jgi:xanthine dehydrogenase molybdopterin-binding subunit B
MLDRNTDIAVVAVHRRRRRRALTGSRVLYFIYACAAAEVEIDVLTGELQILRADILYDAGQPESIH